jgi:hypothetical protein
MMLIKDALQYLGVLLCVRHIAPTNMHALKAGCLINFDGSVCSMSTVSRTLNLDVY